ncbi:MAG: DNA translocase FtsK [Candidatus Omnitrophica bacterium]|nr:DNA translocase FtsK [Candidatus Omnitrophota bacterium]
MRSSLLTPRILSVLFGALALFLLLTFASYHPADLAFLSSEPNTPLRNIGGVLGAWLAFAGRGGFGWAAFILPLLCGLWAVQLWRGGPLTGRWAARLIALLCLLHGLGTLCALAAHDAAGQARLGGMLGYLLVRSGRYYLGPIGTALVALCVSLLSWVLVAEGSAVARPLTRGFTTAGAALAAGLRRIRALTILRVSTPTLAVSSAAPTVTPTPTAVGGAPAPRIRSTVVVPKLKSVPTPFLKPRQVPGGFQLPPLDLLTTPPPLSERQLEDDVQQNAKILEETLRDFGIEASCANIDRGPAVTRYELAPAPGVKLTKIVSLADDIALVMKAASCHIVAPIPGKGRVGVDVPNSTTTVVYVKEILASREFRQPQSPIALAIGKDVSGHPVVTDLRECPHLLVAGATGSGKTVCLNSLLVGILCHASPDEVKFLMIDPKMVELVLFNDIPHLVAPVVTDARKAGMALGWAVQEMERRYQLLAKAGARNIDAYNQKVQQGSEDTPEGRLPYLVIVIDELADLMMIAAQGVEEAITRLSQLSRAVGLHVILATQRPSVDVITGVIKANFPTRIAFQVASKVDSRTILDANGADKLLGRGDLLFLRPGTAKPIRAQGCFVTDEEIERIVSHVKAQRTPAYDERFLTQQERPVEAFLTQKDELYEMAKRLVLETGQASTSFLQRRLRLGYARAARILDLMEQEGLVGPPQGSRPRDILVDQHTPGHQR